LRVIGGDIGGAFGMKTAIYNRGGAGAGWRQSSPAGP